ncbi:hypothetical protein GE061_007385 [Apolygus lucorum]|uniref:Uncharacterized protein n=1 Tax=Apolygus lucorum TaxID=248454 RepID=A0A6A4J0A7_APOLU|nr:hypothetical protein GE061_007385 [Apolygus lucorum]
MRSFLRGLLFLSCFVLFVHSKNLRKKDMMYLLRRMDEWVPDPKVKRITEGKVATNSGKKIYTFVFETKDKYLCDAYMEVWAKGKGDYKWDCRKIDRSSRKHSFKEDYPSVDTFEGEDALSDCCGG